MGFHTDYIGPAFHYLMFFVPPGPRFIPLCYIINLFKCGTLPVCFYLMHHFNNWSHSAYLIAALHGSYGLLWFMKHFILPDAYWFEKATLASALLVTGPCLALYWSSMYIIISSGMEIPPHKMFVGIMIYVFGVVFMLASDTQKYFVLKAKKGLINDGWFARCRNTNYLGEIMLYGSFAFLANSPFPIIFDAVIWSTLFASRWAAKEESFLRKAGGKEYVDNSWYVVPMDAWCIALYAAFGYYLYNYY